MLHGLKNSRDKKVKKLQHRLTTVTLSMCEMSTGGIKTKMTHLSAAEPRAALFGRDRGTASPN